MRKASKLTLLFLLVALSLLASDWPQLRGPNGAGLCASCGEFPTEFGPEKNVVWKADIPEGTSSPILVGDRIFLTAAEGDELITLCLNRSTGQEIWRRSILAPRHEPQNDLNDPAAPTAAISDDSVFAFFADYGLVGYSFEGEELWKVPLGPFNSQHGLAASPVYADGKVVLVADQDTDSYIIGVDAENGEIAWKTPRHVINGYSSPIIHRPDGGPAQVIAPGSYELSAYNVADGKRAWFVRGMTCQPKSAPAIVDDTLYFNGWTSGNDAGQQVDIPPFEEVVAEADANGDGVLDQPEVPKPWQPTGSWRAIDLDRDGFMNEREWTFYRTRRAAANAMMAVKLGGEGDVTDTHVRWRYDRSLPDVPSPLVYNDVVFLFKNGGIATSLDAKTGEVIKRGRLTGALDNYYASPIGVDGKVYIATERGKVAVISAKGKWEVLAVNDFGSDIYATPAIADGRMFVRTRDALYAIGL